MAILEAKKSGQFCRSLIVSPQLDDKRDVPCMIFNTFSTS